MFAKTFIVNCCLCVIFSMGRSKWFGFWRSFVNYPSPIVNKLRRNETIWRFVNTFCLRLLNSSYCCCFFFCFFLSVAQEFCLLKQFKIVIHCERENGNKYYTALKSKLKVVICGKYKNLNKIIKKTYLPRI